MNETHEIVEFGEPFYGKLCPTPCLGPAFHSIILDTPCELGEGPIYRSEDDTLHFVDLLSTQPEVCITGVLILWAR